jgi:hypothetical protein
VAASTEAFQRAPAPTLQVELPTASAMTSNLDPTVGEECRKVDLDTVVWEGTRSLDLKAVGIQAEVVAATWKVHWLREIHNMISWVPGYSENPVTQQRSSHA